MNKLLLIFTFLFSTTALAEILTWDQLEKNKKYTVAYDIQFDEHLTLKAGSPLYFNEIFAGGVPVMVFSFGDPNCKDANFESEIALFNPEPEDTDHDKTLGIQFTKECNVDVYIEPRFYYNKSIFTE